MPCLGQSPSGQEELAAVCAVLLLLLDRVAPMCERSPALPFLFYLPNDPSVRRHRPTFPNWRKRWVGVAAGWIKWLGGGLWLLGRSMSNGAAAWGGFMAYLLDTHRTSCNILGTAFAMRGAPMPSGCIRSLSFVSGNPSQHACLKTRVAVIALL